MSEDEAKSLRAALQDFLHDRLQLRLEEAGGNAEKKAALIQRFEFDNWFAYAAERMKVLQGVTHAAKFSHPSAKGATSILAPLDPEWASRGGYLGTGVLGEDYIPDLVTANAANLDKDINQFLRLEFRGIPLFKRVLRRDEVLRQALSDDSTRAAQLLDGLGQIAEPLYAPSSHVLSKQLYWLAGDDPTHDADYHLLAPLHASSLSHRVFETVNKHRFGEAAKAAREARREKRHHPEPHYDYPGLAVQKMGGTKPQNISQLNSERGGNNYLFASLPPVWRSRDIPAPLNTETVFGRNGIFARRKAVRALVSELRRFLGSDPGKTMATRDRRDELSSAVIDELLQFAAEINELAPGWSARPECQLPPEERLWLDGGRAANDEAFRTEREAMAWPESIRHRFATWLNGEIGRPLSVGDVEYKQWSDELENDANWARGLDADRRWMARFDKELSALQEELCHA
ncbi:type I-F CRISPR-associated protein Csy1 [Alkalilimnicola sp. S0819]|uniref:type I-F CRISPR-associated protein Csy1 n=1 Tax=Alkalilimnicola sp. S0819 TaxID=2613922 RepID=UPI001869EBEA|nr:type I-F CRISPR-associated protein Csy1 [Alkalilimnicola sp. S0819]